MPPGPEGGHFVGSERELLLPPSSRSDSLKPSKQPRGWASGPDSVLSWFIAVANFLINFIVVGLGRMSGILYVVFMHKFGVDRQASSVPFSVQQAARNLFGPAAGILGQKYGVLSVTVVGGLIGSVSAAGCFFAKDIDTITLLWGLGFGVCTAFTTTLNQVPIDAYFEKYRTSAGGLAFSGGCVGAFFFPVALEFLLHHYGVKGTFMAMGCFILIVVPTAFTLRHPPWKNKANDANGKSSNYKTFDSRESENILDLIGRDSQNHRLPKAISNDDNLNNLNSSNPTVCHTREIGLNLSPGTSKILNDKSVSSIVQSKRINFAVLKQNSEMVYQLFSLTMPPEALGQDSILDTSPIVKELEDLYNFLIFPKKSERPPANIGVVMDELTRSVHIVEVKNDSNNDKENGEVPNYESFEDNPRWVFMSIKLRELCDFFTIGVILRYFPVQMHSIVIQMMESLKDLNELVEQSSAQAAIAAVNKTPDWKDDVTSRQERRREKQKTDDKPSNSFCQHIMTAIRMHKNPVFLLISLCRAVFMLTFIPMVTIIVDFAMDKGIPRDTGKYVIATLSLGDLVGRLCLGWITDTGILSMPNYMLVAMVILGVSSGTLPFMHSELSLFPAVMVFGMLQGSLFIRHQVLVSRYLDAHEQTIGMGFINFLSGILGFFIPFYLGYFRDNLGSYDKMFYLNGGICAFVGLMWIFEPCFRKYTSVSLYEKLQDD